MQLNLSGVSHAIDQSGDLNGLWRVMVDFFQSTGFGWVGYTVFKRGQAGEVSIMLSDGIPDGVVQAFADLGFGKHDPNFRYILATGRPILHSRVAEQSTLTRAEQQHRITMEKLGVGETLALPLFGPHNYIGALVLGDARAADLFEESNWGLLQMVGQAAHLKGFSLLTVQQETSSRLSEREVEILNWVAQGKSNGVIGDILDISPSTVDTYLRRLFAKLDVADRTAAAVRGVSEGLIRV